MRKTPTANVSSVAAKAEAKRRVVGERSNENTTSNKATFLPGLAVSGGGKASGCEAPAPGGTPMAGGTPRGSGAAPTAGGADGELGSYCPTITSRDGATYRIRCIRKESAVLLHSFQATRGSTTGSAVALALEPKPSTSSMCPCWRTSRCAGKPPGSCSAFHFAGAPLRAETHPPSTGAWPAPRPPLPA